jgi:exodeoxyribonuclease VII large subunit
VAVVVEVADQRHLDAHHRQPLADPRHRGGGLGVVDGDPHQLRTGAPQLGDLACVVAATSAVSVLVIDCTTTGAAHPHAADPPPGHLITSPTGAAVRDVLSVLARRCPLLDVEILPVPVQGEAAAAQIAAMLRRADASGRYDALLLARGGGSLEDLWAFNDESLARAIAAASTPVVSAVGHETDFTLADFAADVRAPTPSVAAELLVPHRDDLLRRIAASGRQLQRQQQQQLRQAMQRADRAALRLRAQRPRARLDLLRRRQDDARRRLDASWAQRLQGERARLRHAGTVLRAAGPGRRIAQLRERLASLAQRPQAAIARGMASQALHLRGLARALEGVSPLATVARGFAILQREDGRIVRRIADAAPGDRLQARVSDGTLPLRVEKPDPAT